MQQDNTYGLREDWKQLSSLQLEQLLQTELERPEPDRDTALQLLEELKARQAQEPAPKLTPQAEQAWKEYCAKARGASHPQPRQYSWLLRVACIAAVMALLVGLMTYRVDAEPLWKRLVRWTDSVIEFFGPDSQRGDADVQYQFRTEHPGLQQVYDTVTALGITQPIVPMWLPDGYELTSCEQGEVSKKRTITASFLNTDKWALLNIAVYSQNATNQYQKDHTQTKVLEIENIEHYVVRNKDAWVVIWTVENIECSIMIDCHEDDVYKVLRSIYSVEVT